MRFSALVLLFLVLGSEGLFLSDVLEAILQVLITLDALERLLGCVLVAFFLAVAVTCAAGDALDED